MRSARSVRLLLALVLGLSITAILPATASAATTLRTITVDLNGDGIPDQVAFGQVAGTTCSVTVSHGKADGTFGKPQEHDYTTLEKFSPYCPDVVTAVKLGNHKKYDFVGGFSFGGQDMMVIHNFQATATYPGLYQPDTIRTADFDGDGRQDLIEISGQEDDLQEFHNNADGSLSRGPVGECAFHPQYVLADFNGDGGQDMLLSDNCPPRINSISAEILFGNGQAAVTLDTTSNYNATWTVFSIDVDYDGVPDVGVAETASGATTVKYFRNNGHGAFTPWP